MPYNNIPQQSDFTTGWGLSCLIEGAEKTILFDTGVGGRPINLFMAEGFYPPGLWGTPYPFCM